MDRPALEITSDALKTLLKTDPLWIAKHATEETPVVVTDYCDLSMCGVKALSPYILFKGKNEKGQVARFEGCTSLRVAEGIYDGSVDFSYSGITRIDPKTLIVLQKDIRGNAADFTGCPNLEIAQGTFPGWVSFAESDVKKIDMHPETGLHITQTDSSGRAASFMKCGNLEVAQGNFPGFVDFSNTGITRIQKLVIDHQTLPKDAFKAEFRGCLNLKHCPKHLVDDPMISIMPTAKSRIEEKLNKEERARKTLKQPNIEL